jgi:hypothetical protein
MLKGQAGTSMIRIRQRYSVGSFKLNELIFCGGEYPQVRTLMGVSKTILVFSRRTPYRIGLSERKPPCELTRICALRAARGTFSTLRSTGERLECGVLYPHKHKGGLLAVVYSSAAEFPFPASGRDDDHSGTLLLNLLLHCALRGHPIR